MIDFSAGIVSSGQVRDITPNAILPSVLDTPDHREDMNKNPFPLVSILIPTYQGEKFLGETLSSALSQTYPHLEIILSDDSSTDQTLQIARIYQEQSPHHFKIFTNPDQGMINNWNYCISQAQGDYIKFLFQDDILKPNCLEEMVKLCQKNEKIGMVFCQRELILSKEAETLQSCLNIYNNCQNLHEHWSILEEIQSGETLLKDPNFLQEPMNKIGEPSNVLIKKEVFDQLGTFDADLCQVVDVEMWARVMLYYQIGFIDQTLSYFRIHPEQESVKNLETGESIRDHLRFYKKLLTSSYYNLLPESLKMNIYEKLENYRNDLEKQRDRGIARIQQLEAHEADLESELRKTQSDFFRVQKELEKCQATLQQIKSSLFGKMLFAGLKLKRIVQESTEK
ncbi:glycosyltransferase family 2 protein [Gloeothece verrucosa]|uniref:Glycosyl transferase family 2 n=1 Tax=Gloeothece verrucosa (strain PCC 7822) TaxID=497965 RepID=E0UDE9_GLOV7|nr:glycosyltransferase [Gloeothece verrucosa]ADN14140.1 glycosyl transferase family 2 [Gloeothece verrucosa PCC 7822]